MNEDTDLLRQFVEEGSQAAFAELVQRRVSLVYAAALRQTGGDTHLAQDVVQGVFIALAAGAARLTRHAVLTGWLFTTTRHLAIGAVRRQRRWQRRAQEAVTMKTNEGEGTEAWSELRPVIDAALHELGEKDRVALLLRFFEGRSFAELGEAIGLTENTARMRVERALEKLRTRLARRGITSTAAALGGVLAAQPATAVPMGLAANAAGAGMAAAAVGGGGALGAVASTFVFMNATKLVGGGVALIALGAFGGYLGARQQAGAEPPPARRLIVTAGARGAGPAALAPATLPTPAAAAGRPADAGAKAGTAASASPPALEALRVLLDLQRRKLAAPGVKLVGEDAAITEEFVELFALSMDEKEALQNALGASRRQLASLERENTRVSRAPNGDVTIEIHAYPERGGAVYDAMLRTFAETLGPERQAAFVALGVEQAEKALGRFGTAHSTVIVSREASTEGEVRYRIREQAHQTPGDNSNYLSDRLTPERFLHEAGAWLDLLPAGFAPRR